VPNGAMRMDIPWGVMTPVTEQIPGANKNWLAFQRWIDVSNDKTGVTWTGIEAPLVEVGEISANIMGIGGAWRQRIEPTQTLYSWALNNHWFTNFPLEQSGVIPFHYALLPHNTGYDAVAANRFGMEQNRPLIASTVKGKIDLTPFVTVDNPRVVVSEIKSQTKGVIVALRSLSDKEATVKLNRAGSRVKSVTLRPNGCANVTLP
jgi:alpha-mannosidase